MELHFDPKQGYDISGQLKGMGCIMQRFVKSYGIVSFVCYKKLTTLLFLRCVTK